MRTAVIVVSLLAVSGGLGAGAYLIRHRTVVQISPEPREDEAVRRARLAREVHEQMGDPQKHYHNAFKD